MDKAPEPDLVFCRDKEAGCTNSIEREKLDTWYLCQITARYRCWPCFHALRAAGSMIGPDGETKDTLPATSRGAIAKETASSISAPVKF